MPKSLVLGLGNGLAGADGFGPAVLEQLRDRPIPDEVDLVDAGTDMLAHIDRFHAYDLVVLVDAVLSEDGPRVEVVSEETFGSWQDTSPGVHEISPILCVKLFRTLQVEFPPERPVIVLVALMVPEREFSRPPADEWTHDGAVRVLDVVRPADA